ncbi:MAG TPA: helix-turn-helix transcriptional regulator [Microthrixaceae bacterium]|nr:hypothetical protein [Microthrixaceae bacterium]MCO5305511.1 helix-turn-helix transcriptional regulator [Microthrixaceae bacterium]HPG15649.1 helix-turn-helix transcriptional regulator [Microthrixaceae bacterium]
MSIEGLCATVRSERDLRIALLDELRRSVPFDAYAWVLTDPRTEVGASPVADVPCLSELPRLIRLRYATEHARWTGVGDPVVTLVDSTAGRPEQSRLYRELLVDLGVSDVASVVFRDVNGCWAFLDLWRMDGTFDPAETRLLRSGVEPITAALRRCVLHTFADTDPHVGRSLPTPVVILLDDDLRVREQTPTAEGYLATLLPPEADQRAIPAGAYNVAAQFLAVEDGVDDHEPAARVHVEPLDWLVFRAARLGDDIAVTIERASPFERLELFARAAGLSPRESELVEHLTTGADTRQVAALMFVSENTVQDHLKAVFAKTGVRSRRELLARVAGR